MGDETGRVLSGAEATWLDEERAEQAEACRVAFDPLSGRSAGCGSARDK
ncbi:MAG TPA: hypothetical protein VG370_15105 [Chloroflexota bacterium]|nr:hypothetical protein [Chloroflexota bacterium]